MIGIVETESKWIKEYSSGLIKCLRLTRAAAGRTSDRSDVGCSRWLAGL